MTSGPNQAADRALRELHAAAEGGRWPTPSTLHYALTCLLIDAPRPVFEAYRDAMREAVPLSEACREFNADAALRAAGPREGNDPPPVAGKLRVVDRGDGA